MFAGKHHCFFCFTTCVWSPEVTRQLSADKMQTCLDHWPFFCTNGLLNSGNQQHVKVLGTGVPECLRTIMSRTRLHQVCVCVDPGCSTPGVAGEHQASAGHQQNGPPHRGAEAHIPGGLQSLAEDTRAGEGGACLLPFFVYVPMS